MSPEPLAILTSDWHLATSTWKWRSSLCGDALFGLDQIVELARNRNLPILAAGDLFSSKEPRLDILLQTHRRLAETYGIYIQGNHEKRTPAWMELVAPHWHSLERQPIRLDVSGAGTESKWCHDLPEEIPPLFESSRAWKVFGLDFRLTPAELAEQMTQLEAIARLESENAKILVLHQACDLFVPKEQAELTDGIVPDCFDLVVVGHIHIARSGIIRTQNGRPIPCLSPGGTHLCSIDEQPTKKMYLLLSDGSVRSIPLLARRILRCDFSGMTDTEIRVTAGTILATIQSGKSRPATIAVPILQVFLDHATSPHLRTILESELGDQVHLFYKRTVSGQQESELYSDEELDLTDRTEHGLLFAREIFPRYEPNETVRQLVETLLDREPSQELYNRLKTNYLERYHAANHTNQAGELLPTRAART